MNQLPNNQKGFTFIELILYISIVTIIINTLVPFALNIIGSGAKSATQQEVFTAARYISERIKYEVRNSTGINSVSSSSISLGPIANPTIIQLNGTKVQIDQGAGFIDLHSKDTKVTSLIFTNYTSADNKTKHIGFTITVEDNYSSARHELTASTTLESSAEVRSN